MNAQFSLVQDSTESGFVEVLTSATTGGVFGHKLKGAQSGPHILVAGHQLIAPQVYDRLIDLPTLPWMRGTITMVVLEALGQATLSEPQNLGPEERFDELLFLPFTAQSECDRDAVHQGYWTILRLCARLGMIDGRGVVN